MKFSSKRLFIKNRQDICWFKAKHFSGTIGDDILSIGVLGPKKESIFDYQYKIEEEPPSEDHDVADTASIAYKTLESFITSFPKNSFCKIYADNEIIYIKKTFVRGIFHSFEGNDFIIKIQFDSGDILDLFYSQESYFFFMEQVENVVSEISKVNKNSLGFDNF